MAESFTRSMGRTHNTAPIMNDRRTDGRNIAKYGAIGVITGFHVGLTTPNSVNVSVTRGVALGPGGKEVLVGTSASLSASDFQKALTADASLFNVRTDLGAAVYDAIDPAVHSILITVRTAGETLKAHKITVAEAAAITNADLAGFDLSFEPSTGDHAARQRVSLKNPDNLNAAAANTATEFILAIVEKDVAGVSGVIDTVTLRREKSTFTNFTGLP